MLVYTNIQHNFRKKHNLSCNEYVLLDMIYVLHTNPDNKLDNWCYMSKNNLAKEIGISKMGLMKMIDRLVVDGFIIKNDATKHLRTTEKWWSNYVDNQGKESLPMVNKVYQVSKQSLPDGGKQSLPHGGKQSLPNNNTIDNNTIDNNIDKANERIDIYTFDEWWDLYNKKLDRKDCEKKWNKIPAYLKAQIFLHTKKYIAATPDVQYRKNPLTYLNKESWNNDIVVNTANTAKELGATASFHTTDYSQKL